MPAITTDLVQRLVTEQFPEFADLEVREFGGSGWDNTTVRLGSELSVRLPNGPDYELQVEKEHRWLPTIAAHSELRVPEPVAKGKPGLGYPHIWSIYRWIEGSTASLDKVNDPTRFAAAVGAFLLNLRTMEVHDGPLAGQHSQFRGTPLQTWEKMTRQAIDTCSSVVDPARVGRLWDRALDARFEGTGVWFHGDVSAGNLLTIEGELSAVIDFGCCGVGDPACDLAAAHLLFDSESRGAFREANALDDATWERGRGWALWKALLVLQDKILDGGTQPEWFEMGWRTDAETVINDLISEE